MSMAAHLPMEVQIEIDRVMGILDENYNDKGIDGGYIVILESHADMGLCPVDMASSIYEFADLIKTSSEDYVSVLYLVGTEYSITVIMPLNITPKNIREDIIK